MARTGTLNRRRILEAALEVADGEGLEAVTMRRVAQRLGAGAMSLYHYVPNKEALLTGVVDLIFEEIEQVPEDMEEWVDRLVFVSLSFRRVALSHPVLVTLLASGYVSGPVVMGSTDAYLEAIANRGFGPEGAARVYRSAASYIVGYLSLELGGYFGSVVQAYGQGIQSEDGPAEYPLLSEVGPHLEDWQPEEEFEAGLRRLLSSF